MELYNHTQDTSMPRLLLGVSYAVFHEAPDVWTWVGDAVIIASGLYVGDRERLRCRARFGRPS
ncbi:hypothetical protein BH10PSE6_BH10PSE6_29870 [soil metagenome]